MNQLNQLFRQIQAIFVGMNAQSRVLAVLMLGAILVGGGFLVQGYTSATKAMEYVFGGQNFSTKELDQMEMALSSSGSAITNASAIAFASRQRPRMCTSKRCSKPRRCPSV